LTRAELLAFDGVSRSVLEARIRQLVAAIESLEARVRDRRDNAERTASVHPDPAAIMRSGMRAYAYSVVLDDLREMLGRAVTDR
jgi:hypothetical protein